MVLVVVALAIVAGPVATLAMGTLIAASGCLIECSTPQPAVAVATGAGALLLLAVPVVVGVATWRRSWRVAGWAAGILAVLACAAVAAQAVI
jgi:hypothetical protein